jgi:hypothetical protein
MHQAESGQEIKALLACVHACCFMLNYIQQYAIYILPAALQDDKNMAMATTRAATAGRRRLLAVLPFTLTWCDMATKSPSRSSSIDL